jgi:glucokinase
MQTEQITILAGDIGGTSARLACFQGNSEQFAPRAEQWYSCQQYGSLTDIVRDFQERHHLPCTRACFGVAGTVHNGEVHTPNLPWSIKGEPLAAALQMPSVQLLNDLEANVHGIAALAKSDLLTLNRGEPHPAGTIAVISPGTGLGESTAYWNGTRYQSLPSEAGHADFAPRNDIETQLLLALRAAHGRVSCERVISGPGLRAIYRFLSDTRQFAEHPPVVAAMADGDPSAAITQAALAGTCPLCAAALDLFVSCLGAEAGNLALRSLARGGIYLGGGIVPKIVSKLKEPAFMLAFAAKGRLSPLVESIPVQVILNERTALLGAARYAFLDGN